MHDLLGPQFTSLLLYHNQQYYKEQELCLDHNITPLSIKPHLLRTTTNLTRLFIIALINAVKVIAGKRQNNWIYNAKNKGFGLK